MSTEAFRVNSRPPPQADEQKPKLMTFTKRLSAIESLLTTTPQSTAEILLLYHKTFADPIPREVPNMTKYLNRLHSLGLACRAVHLKYFWIKTDKTA